MKNLNARMILWAAILTYAALAQTPDTGSIQGRAVDQSHMPVAGARVSVVNSLTGSVRDAETNRDGEFTVTGLAAGTTYNIRVSKRI
jgi:hypothetical protein